MKRNIHIGGQVGKLLWVGIEGTKADKTHLKFLRKIKPGGIVLFEKNLSTPKELFALTKKLRKIAPFLAIDMEGGAVNRFRRFGFEFPSAYQLYKTENPRLVFRQGFLVGELLNIFGINVNFAPVVDLSEPDAKNGIGERSFSTDPRRVVKYAGAFIDGLSKGGVLATLKHFPGLGATARDSHKTLPIVRRTKAELFEKDFFPFKRLKQKAPFIMAGHGYYPALSEKRLPASLSESVVGRILRKQWRSDNIIVSDDIGMRAVPKIFREEHPEEFLFAGCDMIVVCDFKNVENVFIKLESALKPRKNRVAESFLRILRCEKRLPPPPRKFSPSAYAKLKNDSLLFAEKILRKQ